MTKTEIFKALEDLPEETTVDEAMERLYLLAAVQRGIEDIEAGRFVSQEEAKERFRQ